MISRTFPTHIILCNNLNSRRLYYIMHPVKVFVGNQPPRHLRGDFLSTFVSLQK